MNLKYLVGIMLVVCAHVLADAASFGASFSFTGGYAPAPGDWHYAANWTVTSGTDSDGIPDLNDDVLIDVAWTVGFVEIRQADAFCNSVTLVPGPGGGGSDIDVFDYTLKIAGGNDSCLNGKIVLGPDAKLKLSGTQTISGSGGIILGGEDMAQVEITGSSIVTFNTIVRGAGLIHGSGTFLNSGTVQAGVDGQALELAVLLDDTSGAHWVADFGGELVFGHTQTGSDALIGSIDLLGCSVLRILRDVTLDDGSTSTFTWDSGTLQVAIQRTFTYRNFDSSGMECRNPDTSGGGGDPPYEVLGGNGGYSNTCCP